MTVITTGVTGEPVVARQEIRTMLQDQDLFTLYILGLERFQQIDESDPLSWYQISGIHGRPYIEYDPPAGSTATPAGWTGYCTHSSILFPVWHRPYLALFEQTLAKHVTDIANEYTGDAQQRYIAAAQRFRIPYWDWAYYADPPDVVSRQENITLNGPKEVRTLPNPLYQYKFHPNEGVTEFGTDLGDEKKFQAWPSTLRQPTSDSPNATSQGDLVDAGLHNQTPTIRESTYNLLLSVTDYGVFSNDLYPGPNVGKFPSIEQIHNGIHVSVGGGGHMTNSDFAAFDPIFMLHHANVDRVFALWQALHPDAYLDKWHTQLSLYGTFTTKNGATEDIKTPLTPFRQSKGGYLTSSEARDTRKFKYTYPELAKWESLSPEEKASRLNTDVIAMYGNSDIANLGAGVFSNARASVPLVSKTASSSFVMSEKTAMATEVPQASTQTAVGTSVVAHEVSAPQKALGIPAQESSAPITATSGATPISHYNEWSANIVVEKYAAKTSFSVHIFLGDFNPDPAKWAFDKNLVGTYSVFTPNLETTGCARCQTGAQTGALVTGTIPLTQSLVERLGKDKISALKPEDIIPYLTKELHWRVETADHIPIERADIPSLKVSVAHVPVSVPSTVTDWPTWGEHTVHAAITTGRPGGASAED